ncbi:DNA polymerase ligase N-terminal domain-containing protein [Lentisalinibacter orientalis]|uniref:DNA polymerase ligase N-terminal domain-containing protein n=1 Tax=Lentisalinibacter orientalis TaxID=2992241 RepID=UPI0038696F0E
MPSDKNSLGPYRKKRDFSRTPEPATGGSGNGDDDGSRRFVIQKHDASSLHYDFRLEFDGTLKSWAVPKGPSTDPREKRLAIRTEDHPLDYADFEGVIPEDEYGGGTVMVWDAGTYRNLRADKGEDSLDMPGSLRGGLIEVWLDGEKLKGGYALKRIEAGEKSQWLLIKMDDDEADARRNPTNTENRSVKTGRTLHQIAKGGEEDS